MNMALMVMQQKMQKIRGEHLANDNNKEIIKLDDYRKRYALYRKDKDLQALHHRHPFIVIWDDHGWPMTHGERGRESSGK